ncbi:acetamidase/formamidase family protein [Nonomuraea sp. K274]|uniref:Acetamidase/formamidase family protein n=1 Tax=Nonomuraea cypriaca TaxID=1187855 RepID=A0A931AAV4_9ACTN|nr:acetamidase/formamidase family protein [Nonomuraea cypriaca]MBF8187218.1 acetamidase/formamidase family protein [Nonomuraea cypriaca]
MRTPKPLQSPGPALGTAIPSATPGHPEPVVLATTQETALWGHYPTDRAPVLTVDSGTVVRIDAVNQAGVSAAEGPVAYFEALGVPAGQVLPELAEIAKNPRPDGASGHVLTGPIHVRGAEPGDVLEIRVLDVSPRVPYGVNSTGPGSGVCGDLLDTASTRLLRLDDTGRHYVFGHGIKVPFKPFAGIMAVAPPTSAGFVSAYPPDRWGGNMDFRDLVAGTTLYLPVFQPGGVFYIGDTHGAQGHGEVDQTAVEHSMAVTARFVVRKGASLEWPRAESDDYFWCMGIDADLDVALQIAVKEAVGHLVEAGAGRLTTADAYALCSIAVDFVVAEAVDGNKVIVAYIPKSLLATR